MNDGSTGKRHDGGTHDDLSSKRPVKRCTFNKSTARRKS